MQQKAGDNGDGQRFSTFKNKMERIDGEILSLLTKRQDVAASLGQIKAEQGTDLFEPDSEASLMAKLSEKKNGTLSEAAIRHIFGEIIAAGRSVLEPLEVAFLGPDTGYTHQAARDVFGHSTSFHAAVDVEDVFKRVDEGTCRYGVVPIENAFEGSIGTTLDLLRKYDLKICGESLLRIRHDLLVKDDGMEDIKYLYAHPMAAAQCRAWITNHLPGITLIDAECSSTAARMAVENPEAAALGSRLTADTYGLKMAEDGIEDQPTNVTRFITIGRTDNLPTEKDKTSILFSVGHQPGALFEVLKYLAKKKINMTRIESRPIRSRSWEYLFFVDLDGHEQNRDVQWALNKMEETCETFKRLGSYPVASSPWP